MCIVNFYIVLCVEINKWEGLAVVILYWCVHGVLCLTFCLALTSVFCGYWVWGRNLRWPSPSLFLFFYYCTCGFVLFGIAFVLWLRPCVKFRIDWLFLFTICICWNKVIFLYIFVPVSMPTLPLATGCYFPVYSGWRSRPYDYCFLCYFVTFPTWPLLPHSDKKCMMYYSGKQV